MKYMGSKRAMLTNGLGQLLIECAGQAQRVIDPFCGSGAVTWYAAQHTDTQVIATDLQECAVVRAGAVLARTAAVDASKICEEWFPRAIHLLARWPEYQIATRYEEENWAADPKESVARARALCTRWMPDRPMWSAYGGYYFSPAQALRLDALRATLPIEPTMRSVALAALITSASICAASPGHTAQPFQPTAQGSSYLFEAWRKDPFTYCAVALQQIGPQHARTLGHAYVADANDLARAVTHNDLVILDPPYSGVQYSRFYHVLETIARGACGSVTGAGRYPPKSERPQSQFSLKTRSRDALSTLLQILSQRRATVILTFPAGRSSNGLAGDDVICLASQFFQVQKKMVETRFSTLGGNSTENHRPARQVTEELILLLQP